jgi:outer membrane protein assembly factor BamA
LHVNYETCGDKLAGGDFEFDRLTVQGRTQMYVGPSQRVDARVKYGTALTGVLPNQRRYLAGGLGTVRGYDYQSLLISPVDSTGYHGGQQMLLANVEYKLGLGLGWWFDLWEEDWDDWDWDWDWGRDFDFDLALFFDAGMVWDDKDAVIDLNDLKSSAGIGFLFGDDDDLRFDIIRTLDESEKDFVFQVRINRMF